MTPDGVRYIRGIFNLSQRDLAKAMSVGPATVARWETSGEGAHSPTGLQSEVLNALHGVAMKVKDDDKEKKRIRGLIVLGIGALIFYLLTNERR